MTDTLDRTVRSPYLSGVFAPIQSEITATLVPVAGEIPADLTGVFVRNSSNPRFEPRGRYHWFDGDGMLHGVDFAAGVATYRNRYVQTSGLASDEAAGAALTTGILEAPDFARPGGPFKDTANTDLVYHAGRLLALWWLGGEPYEIALPGLETVGVWNIAGKRAAGLSAHPKVDPRTGELMWFDYQPVPPYLSYGVIDADGALMHQVDIELPGARLQHDLAITERYSVLMDMSLMWDPDALARGKVRLGFFPDKPSRFGVIPRFGTNTDVQWFDVEPMFMYHTVNAWEEGDEIVLVGCRIDQPFTGHVADDARVVPSIATLRLAPVLYEWRFDLRTGAAKERQLDDVYAEFPRMDNRRLGVKSRYTYSQRCAESPTLLFDGIVRYDLDAATSSAYSYPNGWFGGETVFAPRAGASAEDDGYLLTFAVEQATGASEVYVFDAAHVTAGPVCRLAVPQRVPVGYHTWWVPAEYDALAANSRL